MFEQELKEGVKLAACAGLFTLLLSAVVLVSSGL